MIGKLGAVLVAGVVLAFAVPTMASAAEFTVETTAGSGIKEPVPVGTTMELTGTNVTLTSSTLGEIKCAKLNLRATLFQNAGGFVEGEGEEEIPLTENCTSPSGAVTWTKVRVAQLWTQTSGFLKLSFTAKVDVGSKKITCNVTGMEVLSTYALGGDSIVFSKATEVTAAGCGTIKLDGTFTLETAAVHRPLILE
jgi:hypothetical protein